VCKGGAIILHRPSSWYIECTKGFVHDSEFEIKKSLTVTQDLPDDDDAQEVEEIATLEVSPILDRERSSSRKKFATKTSTTGVSKKNRAIVNSVVASRSATVEDQLIGEADSEPFHLLRFLCLNILLLRADRKSFSSTTSFLSNNGSFVRCASLLNHALLPVYGESTVCLHCVKQLTS
jgi:hypothetical protein